MEQLITLLTHYGYLILFPLAVVEGPIISVVAGLLCTLQILNPFVVIPVIVLGDVTGDCVYYGLGRWASHKVLPRPFRRFIPTTNKVALARHYVKANPVRTIILSKVILGIGLAGLYMAGNAKMAYNKFLLSCLGTSLFQCTVYVIIGFVFGTAYKRIGSLLDGLATVTSLAALAAVIFFVTRSRLKKT